MLHQYNIRFQRSSPCCTLLSWLRIKNKLRKKILEYKNEIEIVLLICMREILFKSTSNRKEASEDISDVWARRDFDPVSDRYTSTLIASSAVYQDSSGEHSAIRTWDIELEIYSRTFKSLMYRVML